MLEDISEAIPWWKSGDFSGLVGKSKRLLS
ncbi:TPA: hypothetical protein QFT03_004140 [Kluyvera ascorbata]|nr:hypothetical protein K7B04_05930 [Kluyvera sp. CRP]HDT6547115.1 hypothetical protein [Kluyvera ascorbata]